MYLRNDSKQGAGTFPLESNQPVSDPLASYSLGAASRWFSIKLRCCKAPELFFEVRDKAAIDVRDRQAFFFLHTWMCDHEEVGFRVPLIFRQVVQGAICLYDGMCQTASPSSGSRGDNWSGANPGSHPVQDSVRQGYEVVLRIDLDGVAVVRDRHREREAIRESEDHDDSVIGLLEFEVSLGSDCGHEHVDLDLGLDYMAREVTGIFAPLVVVLGENERGKFSCWRE
jgi:hypothetical protein